MADKPPFRYLDLPAEIRNKIMCYAFHHEEINPGSVLPTAQIALYSSSAFLAVCKQTHLEGSAMFWEKNGFRLPSGPLENSTQWISKSHVDKNAKLKNVTMVFSLLDVTPNMLWDEGPHPEYGNHPPEYIRRRIAHEIATDLYSTLWQHKIHFLEKLDVVDNVSFGIGNLRLVTTKGPRSFVEKDVHLRTGGERKGRLYVPVLLQFAYDHAKDQVDSMIENLGLEGARESLRTHTCIGECRTLRRIYNVRDFRRGIV